MNKQLAHIFDDSVCLTKRQIKDYVSNHLSEEECHAIEVHLSSCPFCNEAIEGYFLYQTDLIMALSDLNTNFIHEYFQNSMLQVHLNSIAPSANVLTNKNKSRVQPFRLKTLIAAFAIIGIGLMWYFEIGSNKNKPDSKQQTTITSQSATTPSENPIESEPLTANDNKDQRAGNGGSPQRPQLLIGNDRPSEKEKNQSHKAITSRKANTPGIFKAKPEKKKESSYGSSTSDDILKLKPSLTPEKEQAKPIEPLDKTEK